VRGRWPVFVPLFVKGWRKINNEMGKACGTYGREEKYIHGFGGEG
jgi:hypothetical protein